MQSSFGRCGLRKQLRVWSLTLGRRHLSSRIVRGRPEDELPALNDDHGHVSSFIVNRFTGPEMRGKIALVDGNNLERKLTFGELHRQTYSLAESFRKLLGIEKGDVVAIMSPNHINYFAMLVGVPLIGAATTTINPHYMIKEVMHQLNLTEAKAIIAHPSCMEVAEAAAKKRGIPILNIEELEGDFLSLKEDALDYDSFGRDFDPQALVTIPFSSGTTGTAKGVMLTHRNLTSNILQVHPGEGRFLLAENTKTGKPGVLCCPLPYYHIYGMVAGLLVPMAVGATKTIFLSKFDLKLFLSLVESEKITRAHIVPPIILALSKEPFVDDYDLSSLETLNSAAAPLGADIQRAASQRLNCIVKQAWGMTELSPFSSITPDDFLRPSGFSPDLGVSNINSIVGKSGFLTPSTEGKIVSPETGEDLESTQEGEILIRGPQVMKGYLKNKEATDETITPNGWLKTGDIGRFTEEGWIVITDRNKELIKFSGLQIAPAELEALLISMPEIRDAIVIPVLDEKHGEIPRAYVVKNHDYLQGRDISEEMVLSYIAARVSPHKKLRGGVIFRDSVPKSPSGKLLRRVMIKMDRGEE
jgi:4-coumarate--CoA ligase